MRQRITWLLPMQLTVVVSMLLAACSSDDDDDTGFAGVARWQCYERTLEGICDCYGLGPYDDIAVGGTGIMEVPACSGATCLSYLDELGDRMCSCGSGSYTPGPDISDVAPQQMCPP